MGVRVKHKIEWILVDSPLFLYCFALILHTSHEPSARETKSIELFDLLDGIHLKITFIYLYPPNMRHIHRILFIRSDKRQVKNEERFWERQTIGNCDGRLQFNDIAQNDMRNANENNTEELVARDRIGFVNINGGWIIFNSQSDNLGSPKFQICRHLLHMGNAYEVMVLATLFFYTSGGISYSFNQQIFWLFECAKLLNLAKTTQKLLAEFPLLWKHINLVFLVSKI